MLRGVTCLPASLDDFSDDRRGDDYIVDMEDSDDYNSKSNDELEAEEEEVKEVEEKYSSLVF